MSKRRDPEHPPRSPRSHERPPSFNESRRGFESLSGISHRHGLGVRSCELHSPTARAFYPQPTTQIPAGFARFVNGIPDPGQKQGPPRIPVAVFNSPISTFSNQDFGSCGASLAMDLFDCHTRPCGTGMNKTRANTTRRSPALSAAPICQTPGAESASRGALGTVSRVSRQDLTPVGERDSRARVTNSSASRVPCTTRIGPTPPSGSGRRRGANCR